MRILAQILVLLTAYGALVLWLPEATMSPGDLIEGHEQIADDCMDCHSPFRGTPSENCIACHQLDAIGLRTTAGALLAPGDEHPAFHQALIEPACVSCHSDHLGTGRPGADTRFSHELLREDLLAACGDCHGEKTPQDALHRASPAACGSCHGFEAWAPARFEHATLPADLRAACVTCHAEVRPGDDLHRQAGDDCGSCHGEQLWIPATFEHENYFRFDRHHPASPCQSCHPSTLDRYTCYECHEHSARSIAREHREEGIPDFEDCLACHRSGNEHEAERRMQGLRGYRSHEDSDDSDD